MNTALENYTQLARDTFGMSSLWKGPDHLVYVKGSGFLLPFTEEYKRFHYSEIQSFSLVETSRIGLTTLFVILLVVFGGVAALFLGLPEKVTIGLAVTASVFLLLAMAALALLIRHLILGPTCHCDIQTAVSRERLRPLNRLHRTRHAIELLEGSILESQRELGLDSEATPSEGEPEQNEFFTIAKPILVSYGLFFLLAVLSLVGLHVSSLFVIGSVMALLFAGAFLLIVALIASVRKMTPEAIRVPLWGLLGTQFVFIGCGVVYFLVVAALNPGFTVGLEGPLRAFTGVTRENGLVVYSIFLALSLVFLMWSLLGIAQSIRWTKRIARAKATGSENE